MADGTDEKTVEEQTQTAVDGLLASAPLGAPLHGNKEWASRKRMRGLQKWILPLGVNLAWLIFGSVLGASIGMSWADVIYFMAQILTTVGYGDLVPETQGQKIAASILVLTSTLLIVNIVMFAIEVVVANQAAKLENAMAAKEDDVKRQVEEKANREAHSNADEYGRATTLREYGRAENADERSHKVGRLVSDLGLFVLCLLVGTIFYRLVERCTCSYGLTRIEGCVEERCANPDPSKNEVMGYFKTWVDCFYMAVITLSTVGFGDYTAESAVGRVFGAVWMCFGVATTVKLISSFTDSASEMETKREHNARIRKAFRENDENCDGMLSRYEFLRMHLIIHDMATGDQFDSMMRQFDIIAGEDSRVSKREFAAYYLQEL